VNEVKEAAAKYVGLVMEIRVGGAQHDAIQSEGVTRKFGDKDQTLLSFHPTSQFLD
jgi:hypothetical protein